MVCNLTPVYRENYRIGIPSFGKLENIFNSDDLKYGGSGLEQNNLQIDEIPWDGKEYSSVLNLAGLGVLVFKIN
ncbi:1,4-alpha-glucan branching enzyme GlgB [compost metagenome]